MIRKPKFCKALVATRLKKRAAEYYNKAIVHRNISDYLSAYSDCVVYLEIYNLTWILFTDDKISETTCPHHKKMYSLMKRMEEYI